MSGNPTTNNGAGSAGEPQPGPELSISLEGVHVDFPKGWWEDPSNELRLRDGRRLGDARIDGLALLIATTLRKLLAARRPSSGLVGPDGRALVAPLTTPCADTVDQVAALPSPGASASILS